MTREEQYEFNVLKLANDAGKLALEFGILFKDKEHQFALERLQLRRWLTLIDLAPATLAQTSRPALLRIFLASEEAMTWFRQQH